MKPIFSNASSPPATVALLALAAMPVLRAETVSGRITLRGEMQNAAKPGSISFTYSGQLTGAATVTRSMSPAAVFSAALSDAIDGATFRGDLTTYRRYTHDDPAPGRLQKRIIKNARVTVSRRFVTFPGAKVTLERAIDGSREEVQKIRGKGTMRFTR